MKFKVSKSQDAVKDAGGASFIGQSGIYDITINFASIAESKNGANSVNFNIDYNGNEQPLYGPYVTDKEGNELEIGMRMINKLAIISGMDEGDELDVEEETHKVGKDQKEQDFDVITNFSDLPCKVRVQTEYSKYQGEIKRRLVIRNFFREDGASASEIVNEVDKDELGKQYQLELEKYSSTPSYQDDVTPEEAEEWEKEQRNSSGGNATKGKTTKSSSTKKKSLFK